MNKEYFDSITPDVIVAAYASKGYELNDEPGKLNIFGIRSNDTLSNQFDDMLGVLYKNNNNEWVLDKYKATTDPGLFWRQNPMNVNGTAILQPGQHKDSFVIGKHQGKYTALTQHKPLPLWRDNNKDDVLDREGKTYTDLAGINIHRATSIAGKQSTQVDKWSAGCQVIAGYKDFENFMSVVNNSAAQHGKVFTYTLFEEDDMGV